MEASPEPLWAQPPGSWGASRGAAGNAVVRALAAWHVHQLVMGQHWAQRTALEAFWPEEVTEKRVGASKGPGNSRKGQILLILRVNQRAFLQLPLVRARLQSRRLPW